MWIEGISLGARRDILARIESERAGNDLKVEILAKDDLGVVASGDLVLPLSVDLLTRRFQWHDGPLSGKVDVDSLPLPWHVGDSEGVSQFLRGARDPSAPLLDARLLFGGTGQEPAAGARIEVTFPEFEKLRDDRLLLDAIWVGHGTPTNSLGLFEDPGFIEQFEEALPQGGAAMLGSLMRGEESVVTVRAAFPLAEQPESPFPGFGRGDPVAFMVSAEPLRLDEWSHVLPRGTEVGGNLWLSAHGEGPIGDLPLEGSIRMEAVSFRQSFGSNASVEGQIDVAGRSSAPAIKGKIIVSSAVVRLPDSGRELHPVKGEAGLWEIGLEPANHSAVLDTLSLDWGWSFSPVDSAAAPESALTLAESTELDVNIEIPNSFWIRGQGLEAQLAGDLHVELQDGVPQVVGELKAISGQLEVVGARLRLDRGVVHFYGGDASNPGLDLELSRHQDDVRVMVRVTGTALDPRLAFDSDPPMSQSDIMSYLLFGSAASDLDGAQTQLLQDQAAAALSQFAAPMLENELTESLGITMMQLRAGENPDDGLSLVVGKYVTPQILVKYEQSLKDRQKYTVNAEYWLNRSFRIETRLADPRSTGIQLNWSTDY
jgi:hypothetical protein